MKNDNPKTIRVETLSVTYWPRDASVYVEASDEAGKVVLAVEWTPEGAGDVTTDEVSDETSDAVFAAVMAEYSASRRNFISP